jgi:transcription-repair coupling factor (superfamily II helicase)
VTNVLVIESIAADSQLKRLAEQVARLEKGAVHASGLWGSSARLVTSAAAQAAPNRIHLHLTAHLDEADDARDDLELLLGRPCELFPAWESLPGSGGGSAEIEAERLRLCSLLSRDRSPLPGSKAILLVAPIQALMQPVPSRKTLARHTLHLAVGSNGGDADHSPDALLAWAIDHGFERLELVESPGDVARRGEILDLFPPGETHPVRIEFHDETIESIRRFDVSTQRSIETLSAMDVSVMPRNDWLRREPITDLFDYLPPDALIVLDGPSEIHEMGRTIQRRLSETESPGAVGFDIADVLRRADDFPQLHLTHFGAAATRDEAVFDFGVTSVSRFEGGAADVVAELCALARDHDIHVVCDNDGERQRLAQMIREHSGNQSCQSTEPQASARAIPTCLPSSRGLKPAAQDVDAGGDPSRQSRIDGRHSSDAPIFLGSIHLAIGILHRGFEWTRTRSIVVPHHELFHRVRQKRRIQRVYAGRPLESWTDLVAGELVVHVVHGIAIYRGLHRMRKSETGQQEEFLKLEFAEGAAVHVPTSQVDLVQKYIGAAGHRPQISKLGGRRWFRTKEQVAEAVSELAEMLLRVQARRADAVGTAYPADTEWQREFEAAFIYEETEDQLSVAHEIRTDLMRPRPMDRLVCGDVGYGKTELAIRAAFKVIEYGRQVAVLVPTTVLAEQHYETFRERLAGYPFSIGCLSRFRHPAETKTIIDQLKRGQIDIVIGTHRLLSKDVSFADLGLVIIDEEQRFGVEHKERLKHMRETVDVLTLSATPIPRTLHMSLVGLRDISSLQTPPVDRRAIVTQVRTFDEKLIREAIIREMNRDGQVYFIHNYVRSIATVAHTIQRIVPEARIVFGHGQMKDDELEKVMHKFVRREADVLVATTIIESGIDIPSVNTIFINRAERFGLADLHQLRGRVGRSSHRAYCYLLLSPDRPPTGKAAKRLKTIEEFSELGAGFRIAMRDLEIRGAGNLLGKEQSGHIAAVGYEMYCQLLEQTVRRLKNEPDPNPPPVNLDLDVAAHLPQHYIPADRARIEIYRRIVAARTIDDLNRLEQDMNDAFGPPPKQVGRLLELAEIRVLARRFGISSISRRPPDVIFKVDHLPSAEPLFVDAPGSVRMADGKTIHLRLPPAYLETETLVPVLRRMFVRADERAVVSV